MAGEVAAQKGAREQAEKTGVSDHEWPRDPFGSPMIKISCAAAELVPTRQFANVTIGPVVVTRFVVDPSDDEKLLEKVQELQAVAETAVASNRETVAHMLANSASRE